LVYLRTLGIRDVYIYRSHDFPAEQWWDVTRQPNGMRLFGQTNLVGFAARAGFTGFYTYDILVYTGAKFDRMCQQPRAAGILSAPPVAPGSPAAAATADTRPKPRLHGGTTASRRRPA